MRRLVYDVVRNGNQANAAARGAGAGLRRAGWGVEGAWLRKNRPIVMPPGPVSGWCLSLVVKPA